MIRYIGLDVHKRFIEVCILDDSGKPIFRGQTSCLREELIQFAKAKLKRTDRVALEATTNTWPVVEILRPMVAQIVVGNPLKIRAIAEAKIKTDKVDAEVLAQLLRCDFLPSVWQPDDQTRRMRAWLTHRTALMAQKTRVKNQIQGLLGRLLIHSPHKLLWTKAGLAWLKDLELPAHERVVLDSQLRQLASVKLEIELLDQNLQGVAQQEPKVQLLMTIPGVDYVVALGLLAALGDIGRFRDGDQAAAYLGLAPSTRQSAEHCYHGHITKRGNKQTRCLLTQSAQHASRHPGPIGAFFRRLTKRKTRNVAIVAVARKLVTIAFLMLKNNEPYRYARPELMRTKFTKLKILPKGRRPADARTAKQGLADVFQAAGLPRVTVPGELPKGEQRMLADRGLRKFVKDLYQPPPCQRGREATTKSSVAKSARPAGRAK